MQILLVALSFRICCSRVCRHSRYVGTERWSLGEEEEREKWRERRREEERGEEKRREEERGGEGEGEEDG